MRTLAIAISPLSCCCGGGSSTSPAMRLSGLGVFQEDIAAGAALGTLSVVNVTGTPAYTLTDSDGGRVILTGANLTRGIAWDYETHPIVTTTISVSGVTPTIAPRTFLLFATNVLEVTLAALGLSPSTIVEGSAAGTIVGAITGKTGGSSLSLTDDAGGRFAISGTNLVTTAIPTDYETSTLHAITIRETHPDAAPRDTALAVTVTNVAEATLAALTLSSSTIAEDAAIGAVVGAVLGKTSGSSLALTGTAGGKFALSGTNIVTAGALDYETATSHSITLTETYAEASNSPRASIIAITIGDVFEAGPPTLAALTLSANTIVENSTAGTVVGAVVGRTASSFLTMADDAGSRFAISGTNLVAGSVPTDYETATSHSITIREILAGATNTPRDTVLTVNVTDVTDTLPAFTLAWTSAASELTNLSFSITPAPLIGDVVVLTLDNNSDMSSPFATSAANTIDAGEASAGSITFTGITTPLSAGLTYARVNVNRGGLATDSSIASITLTAGAPAWSPLDLGAKLLVFYDPNVPASITGSPISQLNDLSPNADHLTQSNATLRPALDANGFGTGLEGMLFDGTDDALVSAVGAISHPGTAKLTIAGVAKINTATVASSGGIMVFNGGTSAYYEAGSVVWYYYSPATSMLMYRGGNGPMVSITNNTRFRYIGQVDGTTGRMMLNGAVTTTNTFTGGAFPTTATIGVGNVVSGGNGFPGPQVWGGHIGPVIICNDTLTTGEETSLDAWLAAWNT